MNALDILKGVPIKKRITVGIVVLLFALAVYGTVRLYSPILVFYVVEQALIQKAPAGTDPALLRERLQLRVSAGPDAKARMEELFRISAYLEKVQSLTPEQLETLIGIPLPKSDSLEKNREPEQYFSIFFASIGNFFLFWDV